MSKPKSILESDITYFQDKLLEWFAEYGRSFPWRMKSATNYKLIISEIFLQRTKAETVANFLSYFLNKYSSWSKLGDATEREIQEILKPIGLYKQRGTRLHKLAQEMRVRKGRMPKERNKVEELPMMGQYIANAYELYVLKKKSPLLDVNMARVLERYFGPRKLADIRYDPYLQDLSKKVVHHPMSKKINWAILDFASLICKKNNPICNNCFINTKCRNYHSFLATKSNNSGR